MGRDDGLTIINDEVVNISVKQSVADKAFFGDGRSRNTLAHELGHGVWHDQAPMARRAMGNVSPKWLPSFESAEHQTRVFAPAFFINDSIVSTLSTAEDISAEFGISLESASIIFKELIADRDRAKNAERMRKIADEFRRSIEPPKFQIRFLSEFCSVCRNQTLFPLGTKIMCRSCDTVFDRFQDGDSLSE
jgi:Zn-dependent peptidase ImmA (M78 family)